MSFAPYALLVAASIGSIFSDCDDEKIRRSGPAPIPGTVTGAVLKGAVSGATVSIHAIAENGSPGAQIGSATSGAGGIFQASVGQHVGSYLIHASGGSYIDEATGAVSTLDVTLERIVERIGFQENQLDMHVTPLTHIVAAQARMQILTGSSTFEAIPYAYAGLSIYFGIEEIAATIPADLTVATATAGSDEAYYGAILAGISWEANELGVSAGVLADALASDAADGVFDGEASGIAITMAGDTVPLPDDAAQEGLALAIDDFLASPRNLSGLTAADFADFTGLLVSNDDNTIVLLRIDVTPFQALLQPGETQQYSAQGRLSDGGIVPMSASVTWESSEPAVATIDADGMAEMLVPGTTQIRAIDPVSGIMGTAQLSVAGTVQSITVEPATASIGVGATQAFTATATFAGGGTVDVTAYVTWTSSDSAIATIDFTGTTTAVSAGAATITASYGASGTITDTAALTVTP